ncbi:hypothetical protein GOBAR_DD04676 [Gossypium barbadense]|nr:hypothetical protein GOBAR_DD04676 [Gossypium barbadense]
MGGKGVVLVIQKTIFYSDINLTANHFSIPFSQIKTHDFLNEAEAKELTGKTPMQEWLLDPSMKGTSITFNKWVMGSSSLYVLTNTWNPVVKNNQLKKGDMVQIWRQKQLRQPVRSHACKARGSDLRVHFKNTRETAFAIRKLALGKAKTYLEDVMAHKQAIPFRRFCGGVGRTAQAKNRHSNGQGRWPVKSAKFILDLLKNAESNAEVKGLDVDALYISHIQVNQAQKQRRRTYRAHGRINPYMSSPCHIELILSEKEEPVKKEPETQLAASKSKKSQVSV